MQIFNFYNPQNWLQSDRKFPKFSHCVKWQFCDIPFSYFNPTVQCAPFLLASSDTFWISNLLLNDGIMVILIIITLGTHTSITNFSPFISRLTLLLSCAMHFENYPHDEQICRLSMESCKYITIWTLLTLLLKGLFALRMALYSVPSLNSPFSKVKCGQFFDLQF